MDSENIYFDLLPMCSVTIRPKVQGLFSMWVKSLKLVILDENGFNYPSHNKQNIFDNIICSITIATRQNTLNSINDNGTAKLFCCVTMITKHPAMYIAAYL